MGDQAPGRTGAPTGTVEIMTRAAAPAPRCLLVMDDTDCRRRLTDALSRTRHRFRAVDVAATADSAARRLAGGDYGVCFVGARLCDSDGRLPDAILAAQSCPPIIVIGMTAPTAIDANGDEIVDYLGRDEIELHLVDRALQHVLSSLRDRERLSEVESELKRTMVQLGEKNSLLNLALDNARNGICLFDADERLIVCNQTYLDMYGFSSHRVRPGVSIEEILRYSIEIGNYDPPDRDAAIASRMQQFRTPGTTSYEQKLKDGRMISVTHRPLTDGRSVSTCEDVTEFDRREKQHVQEAQTAALAMLDKEARANFLSNLSHEFLTPLNHIGGFAQALSAGAYGAICDKRQLSVLNDIAQSAGSLEAQVLRMLSLEGFVRHKLNLADDKVDLRALVARELDKAAEPMFARDIKLARRLQRGDATLRGDRQKLGIALGEVISNAVKFSDVGGTVRISLTRPTPTRLRVTVADKGHGIPPEGLEEIFKPFGQIDGPYAREQGGVGIGLLLARAIIDAHGGEIAIDSAPGQGTTVHIDLPANAGKAEN